jgi:hippurate hydrolase
MIDEIHRLAAANHDRVVEIRRHLHSIPELAFEERETSAFIEEALRTMEIPVRTKVANTGLIGFIDGPSDGPCLALRADIDALPITEENDFTFVSRHPGRMHACGHDAHMASLLGAAWILNTLRERLPGSVRLLFQPSEERAPGGARAMISEGALEADGPHPPPSAILGQHVAPELKAGTIGLRPGTYMASTDEVFLRLRGEGGHSAEPHLLSSDAVVAAAQVLIALQTIVSRRCPPGIPTVLSFGRFIADGATNVIPDEVSLEGTFRTMDEKWRFRAHQLIEETAARTAAAHGAECSIDMRIGYPVVENQPELTEMMRAAASQYLGDEAVSDVDLWFAGEDFSYFAAEIPGLFYRLGTGNPAAGIAHGLHTPRFTIDEDSLRTGSGCMAFMAWRWMEQASELERAGW